MQKLWLGASSSAAPGTCGHVGGDAWCVPRRQRALPALADGQLHGLNELHACKLLMVLACAPLSS